MPRRLQARHEHGVAALVEPLHRFVQVEGAEGTRVVFRDGATPLGAGDHAHAHGQQALYLRAGMPGTAPARASVAAPGRNAQAGSSRACSEGLATGIRQRRQVGRQVDQRRLDIDRDFHAHRAGGRGQGGLHGQLEGADGGVDAAHAEGRLGDGLEHAQLVRRLVDVGEAPIQVGVSICPVRCSSGVPAVSASTSAPAALPAAVPVLVRHTPRPPLVRA